MIPQPGFDPNLFPQNGSPPTHDYFVFDRAHYRVPRDVNSYYTTVAIWVMRFPNPANTQNDSATIEYHVNNILPYAAPEEELNNQFALQPESDYAIPTPPMIGYFAPTNSDFDLVQGTVSIPWPSPGTPFTFTIPNNQITEFNKDFHIYLNRGGMPGVSSEAVVTILFDDDSPPAGSVDQLYNPDSTFSMVAPQPINSDPPDDGEPGADGQVMSLLVVTNANETVIAGDFASYDTHRRNRVALINQVRFRQ